MYDKAIVVGRGKTAMACARMLAQTGMDTAFYTVGDSLQSVFRKFQVSEKAAVCNHVVEKMALESLLLQEQTRTLLVSAANPWLIPACILEKENLTAVNFHSALLPRHPGRNAEAWAIYEQDSEGGITWHFVNAQVDAGDVIIQKAVPITESMTSFQLLHEQNNAAIEAFEEILPSVLDGTCQGHPQSGIRGKLHYSWERPNDGVLDLNWPGDKISAFLRAMDYGLLKLMGEPSICCNEKKYSWKKYIIENDIKDLDEVVFNKNDLVIRKDSIEIKLCEMKMMNENHLEDI